MAVGAQYRTESFSRQGVTGVTGGVASYLSQPAYDRDVSGAFAELRIPIFGQDNARPGLQRLELSVAGRVESYEGAGSTSNPKIGVLWEPADGVRLRSTYGTSFRAPTLTETQSQYLIAATTLPSSSGNVLSLLELGGNPDLEPETASSWTAGVDLSPQDIPGLTLGATWFRTRFDNQIGKPVDQDILQALVNPVYAPFIQRVNPSNPTDRARIDALINSPAYVLPGLFPADSFGAIVDMSYVNTAEVLVSGIDLNAAYGFDWSDNRIDAAANLSWLLDYDRKITPTASREDLLNTVGQPVDIRARGSVTWSRGPLSAALGVNYVNGYATLTGRNIEAWTTADVQLRWRAPETGNLKGLSLDLNIQNLLDTDPPFYDGPGGYGYDPANADPLGRSVSLQLTKAW
jgi:outer membrane receptor protein involved in Fe transport